MKMAHKEYRVDKTRIGFIKFIFEGHEDMVKIKNEGRKIS
jgi:hypothetical protein